MNQRDADHAEETKLWTQRTIDAMKRVIANEERMIEDLRAQVRAAERRLAAGVN